MEINVTNSYTEIYIGGGNFITEAYPTNFHRRYTRKILTASEKPGDFREVTAAEMERIETEDAGWQRPEQGFIDLWKQLTWGYWHGLSAPEQCGGFNESTGFFWLYDIHDICYSEAVEIVAVGSPAINGISNSISVYAHMKRPLRFRAHLPMKSSAFNLTFHGDHTLWNCDIEQVVLPNVLGRNYFMLNCTAERLRCYSLAHDIASSNCRNLREIVLMCPDNSMARGNFNFIGSAGLTQPSIRMLVDKMKPDSSQMSITVHPDVFAKLTGDTTNAAAAALTPEELAAWTALPEQAAEKDIQFASA